MMRPTASSSFSIRRGSSGGFFLRDEPRSMFSRCLRSERYSGVCCLWRDGRELPIIASSIGGIPEALGNDASLAPPGLLVRQMRRSSTFLGGRGEVGENTFPRCTRDSLLNRCKGVSVLPLERPGSRRSLQPTTCGEVQIRGVG